MRTNIDLSSVVFCGIHLSATSHEMLKIYILDMSWEITDLRLHLDLAGANELKHWPVLPVLVHYIVYWVSIIP